MTFAVCIIAKKSLLHFPCRFFILLVSLVRRTYHKPSTPLSSPTTPWLTRTPNPAEATPRVSGFLALEHDFTTDTISEDGNQVQQVSSRRQAASTVFHWVESRFNRKQLETVAERAVQAIGNSCETPILLLLSRVNVVEKEEMWKVQKKTSVERQNLPKFFEWQAVLAVRGENVAQKRLTES